MIAIIIAAGPFLVCVLSPLFMVGRVEGDEREPIRLHLGGWRNGS
jgi:hypothetical protein